MQRKLATFNDLLNSDDLLKEHINHTMKSNLGDGDSALTRIFKDLPIFPVKLTLLANCYAEAYENDELTTWFNLLAIYINTDLLNSDGCLKSEIIATFEEINSEKWQERTRGLTEKQIAKKIIEGYINEFIGCIVTAIGKSKRRSGKLDALTPESQASLVADYKQLLTDEKNFAQKQKAKDAETEEAPALVPPTPAETFIATFEEDHNADSFLVILPGLLEKTIKPRINATVNVDKDVVAAIQFANKTLQSSLASEEMKAKASTTLNRLVKQQLTNYAADNYGLPLSPPPAPATFALDEEDETNKRKLEKLNRALEAAGEKNVFLAEKLRTTEFDNTANGKLVKEHATAIAELKKTIATLTSEIKQKDAQIQAQQHQHSLFVQSGNAAEIERFNLNHELAGLKARLSDTEEQVTNAEIAKLKLGQEKELEKVARAQLETRAVNAEKSIADAQAQVTRATTDRDQANARAASAEQAARAAQAQAQENIERATRTQAEAVAEYNRIADHVVTPDEITLINLKKQELEPKIAKAIEDINAYQDHLMKAIHEDLPSFNKARVLREGKAFNDNKDAEKNSMLSYSNKKAIIKYDSCEKLKNILEDNQKNAYQKALAFGAELINKKHVAKLEMSRTHPLWDVVKGLLVPFTFIYSIFKKESDLLKHESQAGKNLLSSVTDLFKPVRKEAFVKANDARRPGNRS